MAQRPVSLCRSARSAAFHARFTYTRGVVGKPLRVRAFYISCCKSCAWDEERGRWMINTLTKCWCWGIEVLPYQLCYTVLRGQSPGCSAHCRRQCPCVQPPGVLVCVVRMAAVPRYRSGWRERPRGMRVERWAVQGLPGTPCVVTRRPTTTPARLVARIIHAEVGSVVATRTASTDDTLLMLASHGERARLTRYWPHVPTRT